MFFFLDKYLFLIQNNRVLVSVMKFLSFQDSALQNHAPSSTLDLCFRGLLSRSAIVISRTSWRPSHIRQRSFLLCGYLGKSLSQSKHFSTQKTRFHATTEVQVGKFSQLEVKPALLCCLLCFDFESK